MSRSIDSEKAEALYESVLRRVMWGDPSAAIVSRLTARGLSTHEARSLYRRAWRERISLLRKESAKRALVGIALIATGAAACFGIYHLTEGFMVYSVWAIVLPALPVAAGAWKLVDGLVGILTASARPGPISEID